MFNGYTTNQVINYYYEIYICVKKGSILNPIL